MAKYTFRILTENTEGEQQSWCAFAKNSTTVQEFIDTDVSLDMPASGALGKINDMLKVEYQNKKHFDGTVDGAPSNKFGSITNRYLSASLSGSPESGSLIFSEMHPPAESNTFLKKYKFFGEKVCSVLGLPENVWLYTDNVRLSSTSSETNQIKGTINADGMTIMNTFNISNIGQVTSDIPFGIDRTSDRWLKFTNISSSNGVNENHILLGYNDDKDVYQLKYASQSLSDFGGFEISSSGAYIKDLSGVANARTFKVEGSNPAIMLQDADTSTSHLSMRISSSGHHANIAWDDSRNLALGVTTSPTETDFKPRMTLTSGGTVGIGEPSPDTNSLLHIGTIHKVNNNRNALVIEGSGSNGTGIHLNQQDTVHTSAHWYAQNNNVYFGATDNENIRFQTGNATKYQINAGGVGSIQQLGNILAGYESNGSTINWKIAGSDTNAQLKLYLNGAENIRLNPSTGGSSNWIGASSNQIQLGINNNSPSFALDVDGTIRATSIKVGEGAFNFTSWIYDSPSDKQLNIKGELDVQDPHSATTQQISQNQSFLKLASSNAHPIGLETNILYYSPIKFKFTATDTLMSDDSLDVIFKPGYEVAYSTDGPSSGTPAVYRIDLHESEYDNTHPQVGNWIGWNTRHWPPGKFKIEVLRTNTSQSDTVCDYSQYGYRNDTSEYGGTDSGTNSRGNYKAGMWKIPTSTQWSTVIFTIYEGEDGTDGDSGYPRYGLSNFFWLKPEVASNKVSLNAAVPPVDIPAFQAELTTDVAASAATFTKFICTNVIYDTFKQSVGSIGIFDSSTGIFTAPMSGIYNFTMHFTIEQINNDDRMPNVTFRFVNSSGEEYTKYWYKINEQPQITAIGQGPETFSFNADMYVPKGAEVSFEYLIPDAGTNFDASDLTDYGLRNFVSGKLITAYKRKLI